MKPIKSLLREILKDYGGIWLAQKGTPTTWYSNYDTNIEQAKVIWEGGDLSKIGAILSPRDMTIFKSKDNVTIYKRLKKKF
jgi:hypothetical protein